MMIFWWLFMEDICDRVLHEKGIIDYFAVQEMIYKREGKIVPVEEIDKVARRVYLKYRRYVDFIMKKYGAVDLTTLVKKFKELSGYNFTANAILRIAELAGYKIKENVVFKGLFK